MEPAWHIRRYRNGDEHSVLELERAVYPHQEYDRSAWLKCWHWLHRENPAGPSAIVMAEHNGLIVGHSTIIPVLLKVGSEVTTAFQPVQLMVHPEYRRQGIFLALDRALFAEAKDRNMLVGFGFPATPTYRGAVASLSWFPVATTRRILRVFSWKDALRLKTDSRILLEFGAACGMVLSATLGKSRAGRAHKAIEVRQVPCFDDRADRFWQEISKERHIITVRDTCYLNWRYAATPHHTAILLAETEREVHGYAVLEFMRRRTQGSARFSTFKVTQNRCSTRCCPRPCLWQSNTAYTSSTAIASPHWPIGKPFDGTAFYRSHTSRARHS